MQLRTGLPLWLSQILASQKPRYPTLRGTVDADVAVIGGGLTGAVIAQRFSEAGVRIALVEAARVAHGSTAASTALLLQETDETFIELVKRYGEEKATRIWQLSRVSIRDLASTLQRLGIRCDVADRDAVYYTTNPRVVRGLRTECRHRRDAGFSAKWLDGSELLTETGIHGEGAIRSRGGAQLDPYRACCGLLRAAARCGARIFERSAVRQIERSSGGVVVRTRNGSIRAERVVIATGYAQPPFAPRLRRLRMKNTYVLATRPLRRAERIRLGLPDLLLWNTERPYHYARWTQDHRLLLGGNDRPAVSSAQRKKAFAVGTAGLQRYFEELLPPLKGIAIEYAWEGLFAMTPDGLPFIGLHRWYPRHLFALGYGGNGMTFASVAARLLLESVRGAPGSDHELFAFIRSK
jgi:glycine/D-amino acid oxidase-like deaminating enzyme